MPKQSKLTEEQAAIIVDRLGVILDCIQAQNSAINDVVRALRKVAAIVEHIPVHETEQDTRQ